MLRRIAFITYGCVATVLVLGLSLCAIGFARDVASQTRLDWGAAGRGTALLIAALLLTAAVQHSVLVWVLLARSSGDGEPGAESGSDRRVSTLLPLRRSKTSSVDASQVVASAIKAKFLLLMLAPTVVALEIFRPVN
jgi:hypothetical protein